MTVCWNEFHVILLAAIEIQLNSDSVVLLLVQSLDETHSSGQRISFGNYAT